MRAWCVTMLLLTTGCLTVRVHRTVTVKHQSQSAGVAQTATIDTTLKTLAGTATSRIAALPRLRGTSLVTADTARSTVREFQSEVLARFSGPQYAGIRPELEESLRGDSWAPRLRIQSTPQGAGADPTALQGLLTSITEFVRKVTKRPDNRVTFRVVSEPKEANFKICPQYLEEQCYALMTDGDVADLLRGYYTYFLTLNGYKPVKVDIDMVPFAKKKLRCKLRRNDDQRDAGPCTPE